MPVRRRALRDQGGAAESLCLPLHGMPAAVRQRLRPLARGSARRLRDRAWHARDVAARARERPRHLVLLLRRLRYAAVPQSRAQPAGHDRQAGDARRHHLARAGRTHLDEERAALGAHSARYGELRGSASRPVAPGRGVARAWAEGVALASRPGTWPPARDQYRWLIGSSSAGNSVITRQPLSVTTTSSSMRAAE